MTRRCTRHPWLGGIANAAFFEFGGVRDSLAAARSVLVRRDTTTARASSTLPAVDFDTMLPLISTTNVTVPVAGRADITLTSVAPTTGADLGVVDIRGFTTTSTPTCTGSSWCRRGPRSFSSCVEVTEVGALPLMTTSGVLVRAPMPYSVAALVQRLHRNGSEDIHDSG